jgi:hypothetical protein
MAAKAAYLAGHDLYRQPKTGRQESIPRHADINERLAKDIIKRLARE